MTDLIELFPADGEGSVRVVTRDPDIVLMHAHGLIIPGDIPPLHNEAVASERYGHYINAEYLEDGSQILVVLDARDDVWIAKQPLRKHWLMP